MAALVDSHLFFQFATSYIRAVDEGMRGGKSCQISFKLGGVAGVAAGLCITILIVLVMVKPSDDGAPKPGEPSSNAAASGANLPADNPRSAPPAASPPAPSSSAEAILVANGP